MDEHGGSREISGEADREFFLKVRREADAILIGAKTAATNDYGATGTTQEIHVVTRTNELPAEARLTREGATINLVKPDMASVAALLADCRRRGLKRVLCEGGHTLLSTLIEYDLIDELFINYRLRILPDRRTHMNIEALATNRRFALSSRKMCGDELLTHWTRN